MRWSVVAIVFNDSWLASVVEAFALPTHHAQELLDEKRASDRSSPSDARFEIELEFVQALANPFYLHSLAQQNVLSQPPFINFLEYLLYWKEKEYARFLQ